MIDVFTKYMVIIPIMRKWKDVASGMVEALNKINGKPQIFICRWRESIEHRCHTTVFEEAQFLVSVPSGHSKMYFTKGKKQMKSKETKIYYNVLLTYTNQMKHSAIGKTPAEATKKIRYCKSSIQNQQGKKILRKKAISEKERTSSWCTEI